MCIILDVKISVSTIKSMFLLRNSFSTTNMEMMHFFSDSCVLLGCTVQVYMGKREDSTT